METLMHNQLISLGVLNLVVAAIIYVVVKEKLVLRHNRATADFVSDIWMRNVVVIALLLIIYGVINTA